MRRPLRSPARCHDVEGLGRLAHLVLGLARRAPADDSVVGRVRLVGTHRFKTAEQIIDVERPALHGYRILANWPVKDYQARVVLTAGPEGMLTVTWSGEFTERIPGTGILWRRYLTRFLGSLAGRLIAHAEVTQLA